jgi:ketosteroid isomerase-like protein
MRASIYARPIGSLALGALATGALALGAFAIGTLAIGRLAIGRARIRRLEIGQLVVGKPRLPDTRASTERTAGSNSEMVRDIYGSLARGDMPAVLGALDSKCSWTEADGFPHGGTYIGPDEVLNNVLAKLGTEWEQFSAVPEELITDGETVVVLGEYRGRYNATGKSFTAPFTHVWKMQDGKVTNFRQYTDTALVQKVLS